MLVKAFLFAGWIFFSCFPSGDQNIFSEAPCSSDWLSHTSAAAHPKVVDYFNFGARRSVQEKVEDQSWIFWETLLACTLYAEPDGMGKVGPIHRRRWENNSRQPRRFCRRSKIVWSLRLRAVSDLRLWCERFRDARQGSWPQVWLWGGKLYWMIF